MNTSTSSKLFANGKAFWSGKKPAGIPDRIGLKGKTVFSAVIEDRSSGCDPDIATGNILFSKVFML